MLMVLQESMQAACFGSAAGFTATAGHLSASRVAPEKALYVHTATVTAALTGILSQAFPTAAARMGGDAFQDSALRYLRDHPPRQAVLSEYGAGFCAALPADHCPTADWSAHEAYFESDTVALDASYLARLASDELASAPMPLVASARVVDGDAASLSCWLAERPDLKAIPPLFPLSERAAALIWRGPDWFIAATLLPAAAGEFVRALRDGEPLMAASAWLDRNESLPPLLALLLGQGVLALPDRPETT